MPKIRLEDALTHLGCDWSAILRGRQIECDPLPAGAQHRSTRVRSEARVIATSVIERETRGEILNLAKECSESNFNPGLWLRVSSILESSLEASSASFAVLATNGANRICGVALVTKTGQFLPSCQLFVAPDSRRMGIGSDLLRQALRESESDGLRVWNHGDCPDGEKFAEVSGLNKFQSLALFAKELNDRIANSSQETLSAWNFKICSANYLKSDWKDVLTEAYQTSKVVSELESRAWWPQSWGVVVPDPKGRQLAGVLVARAASYQQQPSIENHVMAVAPEWQGHGISKVLLSGLVALAKSLKLASAISYVEVSNRNAVGAHLASGFSKISQDSVYVFDGR